MKKRQAKKIWNRLADGCEYRSETLRRVQVKDGVGLDEDEDYCQYHYCPVCGSAMDCTCGGTGLPNYGEDYF